MTLLRFNNVNLAIGEQKLLVNASLAVEENERICLIGRNGAGKSTLMRIIMAEQDVDSGELHYQRFLRIAQLEQQLPDALNVEVGEFVKQGLDYQQQLIQNYQQKAVQTLDSQGLQDLQLLQQQIESSGFGWDLDLQVQKIISQLDLPQGALLGSLSGGWRRRAALAKAMVSNPNLLLLDEPTNHLDISTIEWLEHKIRGFKGSVIFITHDRSFLQKLATRIVELERGQLVSWPGGYQNYLQLKEKVIAEEDEQNLLFDKKLEQEEIWIRQGIKARRTRNEGRVRALEQMREQYAGRVKRQGKAKVVIQQAEYSGRKVISAKNICHQFQSQQLLQKFNLKVVRGDRIGLIGNNGVGKSTLLKILLGELTADSGTIKLGTHLQLAYFDQMRRELDETKTIMDYVGEGRTYISINGKEQHIIGYLKRFLFAPQRSQTLIRVLSGGERNRVLLAKLLTKPANLLILDEPTNDLDVEMLEALEDILVNYDGTLIIVSHDRQFLDNVVTSTLVFEGEGRVSQYVGGYSDWVRQGKSLLVKDVVPNAPLLGVQQNTTHALDVDNPKKSVKKRLSYKYQREYDLLPAEIETIENELQAQRDISSTANFYDQSYDQINLVLEKIKNLENVLEEKTHRWYEIEAMLD